MVLLSAGLLCLPALCEARSRTTVTVTIGGSLIIGGAYLAWRLAFSRSSSKGNPAGDTVAYADVYDGDIGRAEGVGGPELPVPELHLPLFNMRF
ncbi:MAG: hypothetical protein V3W31_01330 [Thermodesulfobacteriota bacterium]